LSSFYVVSPPFCGPLLAPNCSSLLANLIAQSWTLLPCFLRIQYCVSWICPSEPNRRFPLPRHDFYGFVEAISDSFQAPDNSFSCSPHFFFPPCLRAPTRDRSLTVFNALLTILTARLSDPTACCPFFPFGGAAPAQTGSFF